MKRFLQILPMLFLALSLNGAMAVSVVHAAPVSCGDVNDPGNLTLDNGINCAKGNSATDKGLFDGGVFRNIAHVLIFLVGAISVIMIIIGGFRYVVSGGNSSAVEGAKNTILYAIIGVIVAILSYAIIEFIIARLK